MYRGRTGVSLSLDCRNVTSGAEKNVVSLLTKVMTPRLLAKVCGNHASIDTMTLDLRFADITGVKYDNHVPLLSCEPCVLAKLHPAAVNHLQVIKPTTFLHAFRYDILDPLKETRPRGAKYMLGVIDHFSS
jgi:hypothetical protein